MAKKKNTIKAAAAVYPVAQNREEAVRFISVIGEKQRERERLRIEMDERIAVIKAEYDQPIAEINDAIRAFSSGLHTFAEANRDELTKGGKIKTVVFMSGELRWRSTPPACKVVRLEDAIKELKEKKLAERFIRTKEEINKEAILADPTAIKDFKWLKVTQVEEFAIVPFETSLEEVA